MNKLWVVTKNEFFRYFISPLAYVYLICFLLLNGSFAVYFGHFLERGQADLLPMFSFQPWLYLLFIPGISMRLWAEEFRTKTILQIITMPVSIPALVWGKFFASWMFCALALLLTFPFWITVNLLGSPDNTVILISYVGSFLLAGCMLAISQTMSALTKNQVIALVFAVIANLVFFLSGIEYILGIFRSFAPLSIIDMVASFSFLSHFETIVHGLLEARDIVFFASLILLFNLTTVLIISFKTAGTTPWLKSSRPGYYVMIFLILLIGFTGLNLTANNLLRRYQYDFTEEKLFTLTDATRNILRNLPEPVTAKLYYSRILGERSPELRLMFDKIRLLLQRYASLSDGKFSYQIYNPLPLSDVEDRALNAGLQPLPLVDTNSNAYFGMTLTDEVEHRRVIPFFPLERQELLEQDLTQALYLLNHRRSKLGLITSLPMFEQIIENVATPKWEIINQLQQFYDITPISDDNLLDLNNIDALMIAHPQKMSNDMQQAIRNYSYRGGKILAFFDIAAEAPRIFAPVSQTLSPSDYGNLPESWGFRFFDNMVVADLGNSSTIDATNFKDNPTFTQDLIQFYLKEPNFNHDFKETALLKKMMLTSAGIFAPQKDAPIYFVPLLQAGPISELLPAEVVYNNLHPAEILRHFEKDSNPKYIAARIISKNMEKPFELIVVGDSDMLYDSFWTVHQTILENNYAIPVLDNANFVLNALDTLLGRDDMINLRGKSGKNRTFEDIETARKLAQQQFKIREKDIIDKIEQTKSGLQEIWGKKNFEERLQFTPDELAIIANIRKDIDQSRQELFNIRTTLNQETRRLENRIKFANIYAVPLLILLGMFAFMLKRRRCCRSLSPLQINRPFVYLGTGAALLLALGTASVWYNNRQDIAVYENRPLFPNLPKQINHVEYITLQNHNQTLRFYRDQDAWKLEGAPEFMVYQERIRSFLSAMLEATFYEKKTSKMEYLPAFGLAPIEVASSPAIRVELEDGGKKRLVSFDVGKFDLDLGRGSKGAYVKFDNQFQVWLANFDLIDLSVKPEDWTFSSVWNLRLGRLAQVNDIYEADRLAEIAKVLLNTSFIGVTDRLENPQPLLTADLQAEGGNHVVLHFVKDGTKNYLNYEFKQPLTEKALQTFSSYANAHYYEITAENMEKIKNVIADRRTK